MLLSTSPNLGCFSLIPTVLLDPTYGGKNMIDLEEFGNQMEDWRKPVQRMGPLRLRHLWYLLFHAIMIILHRR